MRLAAFAAITGTTLLAGAAHATTLATVWQGSAFITAVSSACATNNTAAVGDDYTIVYRPIIVGSAGNGVTNDAGLSFFSGRNGMHYFTKVGVAFKASGDAYFVYLGSRATSGDSGSTADPPTIPYALTIKPAPITTTTPTVTISGTVDDFFGTTGCNISFTSALDLRVD